MIVVFHLQRTMCHVQQLLCVLLFGHIYLGSSILFYTIKNRIYKYPDIWISIYSGVLWYYVLHYSCTLHVPHVILRNTTVRYTVICYSKLFYTLIIQQNTQRNDTLCCTMMLYNTILYKLQCISRNKIAFQFSTNCIWTQYTLHHTSCIKSRVFSPFSHWI